MTAQGSDFFLPLFVPADRPDRVEKAIASKADSVIIDLEDAVAPAKKAEARSNLERLLSHRRSDKSIWIRINARQTEWHDEDLAAAELFPCAGVVVPKAEIAEELQSISERFGRQRVVALIETAVGLDNVRSVANAAGRIAFGSIDFAADLGCSHSRESLLLARLKIVMAARMEGLPGPIDGVTTEINNASLVSSDARYAASLGFSGKLVIHPNQIQPAFTGFMPTEDELSWAQRVLAASEARGAVALDGAMIDAPVVARARIVLERSKRLGRHIS